MSDEDILSSILKPCCKNKCLRQIGGKSIVIGNFEQAFVFVKAIRQELIGTSDTDYRNELHNKLHSCCASIVGQSNRMKLSYAAKTMLYEKNRPVVMCSTAFSNLYGIGVKMRKNILKNIKSGKISSARNTDTTRTMNNTEMKRFLQNLKDNKITLEKSEVALFLMQNSHQQMKARSWMSSFFKLVGDRVPNADGELHLDSCFTKANVYDEYKETMVAWHGDSEFLSIAVFNKIWKNAFSHVKLRVFKQVAGKCNICAVLSQLRKSVSEGFKRGLLTELHAYHRTMYMGERQTYYDRQEMSRQNPHDIGSFIMDGMQQEHSKIPQQAQAHQFDPQVKMHLMGILEHGHNLTIYRSFGITKSDTNENIHCFLLQLERRLLDGRYGFSLPKTIYLQIDGATDNTSKAFYAICALLVSRKIGGLEQIVVTRLPVGHTHEDIDARFGTLWKATRNLYILDPDEYKFMMIKAMSKRKHTEHFRVIDLYAIPNYVDIMIPVIDPKFKK